MGILEALADGRVWSLPPRATIGRATSATVRIADSRLSALHACLQWSSEGWQLRDLGSTNGSWLDNRPIQSGVNEPLLEGNRVAFGDRETSFVLSDAGPPRPSALDLRTGRRCLGTAEGLWLSSGTDSAVLIEDVKGLWWCARDSGRSEVRHGQVILLAGTEYRLELPDLGDGLLPLDRTRDVKSEEARPILHFRVSRDEEHVELMLYVQDHEFNLGARVHHYLLLLLARARLLDEASGHSPNEAGWVSSLELPGLLGTSVENTNHQIWRVRQQLKELGLAGCELIQRRSGSRQLRLAPVLVRESPA